MTTAEETARVPSEYPAEFYGFSQYVTRHRLLTFWYQIDEALSVRPDSVMEVGVGPGIVTGFLRHLGIHVQTVDINPELNPDVLASVDDLEDACGHESADLIICARVLHHLPFEKFDQSLAQLASVTRRFVILTLPVDDIAFYLMFRRTASRFKTLRVPLPLSLKRLLKHEQPDGQRVSSFWKIGSSRETSMKKVVAKVERHFRIRKAYRIPEDSAHFLMVLER